MHFEVLVEGQADRTALEPLMGKVLGAYGALHTWRIHKHRGKGRLPSDARARPNPGDPTLLHNLPASLRAYSRSLGANGAVVVLVDLDDDDCAALKAGLTALLSECHPAPAVLFRIAIEELEAWFLGDRDALVAAYPQARLTVLDDYAQDDVCGTWEVLADAIHPGGLRALRDMGRQAPSERKRAWARDIAPRMDVDRNLSPSFCAFRDGLRRLASTSA